MISIICILGKNNAIGLNNKLLWNLSDDMKRFREKTLHQSVIMGRKTFESIGRPLPDRDNIIITRNAAYEAPGCVVANSLGDAVAKAEKNNNKIFIIGGGQIYKEALPLADKLYLTIVDDKPEADAFFPNYSEFRVVKEEERESEGLKYRFVDLKKNHEK